MSELSLFEQDYGTGNRDKQEVIITSTQLFFEEKELKEFKQLCKIGMREEFGEFVMQRGNYADLVLVLLRRAYANNQDKASI